VVKSLHFFSKTKVRCRAAANTFFFIFFSSFAKNDGEFAVFQRTDTSLGADRVGDAIEYTRNEPIEKGGDNLLLGSSDENGWRWRRANSSSLSQTPLFLLNLFLAIFSFILFTHQIQ
jgi:hypothetical protein